MHFKMNKNQSAMQYVPWKGLIITGCFVTYLFLLGYTMLVPVFSPQHYFAAPQPVFDSSPARNTTKLGYWDRCELPDVDFFNDEIIQYIDPSEDPIPNCDKRYKPLTFIKNGTWGEAYPSYNKKWNLTCRTRCHWRKSERRNIIGKWSYTPGPVDCEVLEAVCAQNKTDDVYGYLHTQITPTPPKTPKVTTANLNQYDVTVILIDSLSHSQAGRSLPRTLSYLTNHMRAVTFPYINKVGDNSRPAGAALWFGKLIEKLDRSMFEQPDVQADWTQDYMCYAFKDNETSLFQEFQNYGYKTLLAEDWAEGTLNWPDCKGFNKPPIDHYMRPFQNAMERKNHGVYVTKHHLDGDMCREYHHTLLDYLGQFIDAYPDQKKFSWIWPSVLGHDSNNGIAHADNDFYKFLVQHRKQLENSFVFFMGDHGLRFGDVRRTDVGALEVNNPFLAVSIPKELRKSTNLLNIMSENAKKLQTHFDTRASILYILKYQAASNFTEVSPLQIKGEKGYSYLRKQPDLVRNCRNSPIPMQYCICQHNKTAQRVDSKLALSIGEKITEYVNEELVKGQLTGDCITMKMDRVISLLKFNEKFQNSTLYTVNIEMKLPSQATYKANVKLLPDGSLKVLGMVERSNQYGYTASCINSEHHRPYCYCKNLLGTQ